MLKVLTEERTKIRYRTMYPDAGGWRVKEMVGRVLEVSSYGLVFHKEGNVGPGFLPWHCVLTVHPEPLETAPELP